MTGDGGRRVRVECQECPYTRIVEEDSELLPGEIVIRHGKETGHKLRVEYLEE